MSAKAQTPDQKYCYSFQEVEDLAKGIVELKQCQAVLSEKEFLIQKRLNDFKGPQEGRLWWQDPAWVGFGIAGSFFLGIVTVVAARK